MTLRTPKRSGLTRYSFLCFLFATLLVSAKRAEADEKKFLDEAPRAWKAALDIRRTLNCTVEGSWGESNARSSLPDWKTQIWRRGEMTLVDNFDGQERLLVGSSDTYAFCIAQIKGANTFALKGVEKAWGLPSGEDSVKQVSELNQAKATGAPFPSGYSNLFPRAAVYLSEPELGAMAINRTVPISSVPWGDESIVSIRSCETADDGSGHVVLVAEIKFTGELLPAINGDVVTNSPRESLTCIITFDGTEWWLPLDGESKYENGAVESWSVEYADEHDGLPLATLIRRNGKPSTGQGWAFSQTLTYPETSVDQDQFKLPFYGLPEPPEFRKSNNAWFLGFAGLVLVLIAFFVYGRRK